MNPQAIERLREIGRTQAGALTTESGIVWHPANELLPAADALDAALEEIARLKESRKAIHEALSTLSSIIGLTAIKYEGQLPPLQEAMNLAMAALRADKAAIDAYHADYPKEKNDGSL